MNVEKIREDFPLLQLSHKGKPIIYFDNTATSLKPKQVLEALNHYYAEATANVHRGVHRMSQESSKLYEDAHKKTGKFINAKQEEIVFTKNTTESFNLLMYSLLMQGFFQKGDEVLVSKMEHHSNIVPWQFLEKKKGIKLDFVELNTDYTLNMQDLESKVSSKTKLVSITHASNTVASITPVQEIAKIAHDNGSLFAVDAAQSAPHMPLDVKKINADFLCFSSHKMLGPTGIGVFYAKKELLEKMPPFLYGGDMIHSVQWHSAEWNRLPYKFEAGTPHIAGGIGFGAAIDCLQKIGMQNIRNHEKELTSYALEKMQEIEGIELHCPKNAEKQVGITLFDAKSMEAHDVALALDEANNIAIRSGMHCAEPLISSINENGLARASFYLYNTKEEIDLFTESLQNVLEAFG